MVISTAPKMSVASTSKLVEVTDTAVCVCVQSGVQRMIHLLLFIVADFRESEDTSDL